jgi:hypothetical protein
MAARGADVLMVILPLQNPLRELGPARLRRSSVDG